MRRKKEAVLCFESNDDGLPKVVRDYRARYRAISQVLDDNPKILLAFHRDLLKLSDGDSQGREGDYTSENIFRALFVQHLEGLPFRDAVIRIGSDPFLQDPNLAGFNGQSYLSEVFHREMGETPAQYRRRHHPARSSLRICYNLLRKCGCSLRQCQ